MNIFKNIVIASALVTTTAFGTVAVAQDNTLTIPRAAQAVNESGPWAGLFDEINKALQNDFLYQRSGSVTNKLSSKGPFTVFVPTDGAFDALKQTLACNGLALSDIPDIVRTTLQYHAVKGAVLAADVVNISEITTLAGATIDQDGGVLTDVAGQTINILLTDITVDNGVIHVIDTVMLPADLGLNACG